MIFIDIHTHQKPENQPFTIYNIDWQKADLLFAQYPQAHFSAGFHPYNLSDFSEGNFEIFAETMKNPQMVAIGECGLDKNITADFELQKQVFEKQIGLSETLQKPLIIHCVGYFNELIRLKKDIKPAQQWIVHGFRGKPQLAEQLLKNDFRLSFGEKFNPESVKITPLNALLAETDESTLSIEQIYQQIALAKNCEIEEFIKLQSS